MAKSIWHRGAIRLNRRNGGEEVVAGVEGVLPGETVTARAAQDALRGKRQGLRALWPFLGPAFVAAVAYVDPGNFATNISGGAQFGYLLLWVILCSNLMAMLIQSMSAKLGIATGKNLPEVCRERFPKPVTLFLWLQAEVIAMATDLAEFIGAALALNLLFGIPLFSAGLLTGVGVFGILTLQRRGFRPLEAVISSLIGVIVLGFAFQMFYAQPPAERILAGLFTPNFAGTESVLLASGILGATVMPHVIYLLGILGGAVVVLLLFAALTGATMGGGMMVSFPASSGNVTSRWYSAGQWAFPLRAQEAHPGGGSRTVRAYFLRVLTFA
jgi:manganese transport protein